MIGGLALAGCTARATGGRSDSSSAVPPSASSQPAPASSPAPTSSAPPVPTREEIVAQLGSQTPVEWGLEVPGVVQRSTSPQVALTLDACGGPSGSAVDQQLIDLLRTSQTPATLFLNARWIDANPALTEQLIAEDLFCIANHGTQHVPLSANGRAAYGIPGTASIGAAYDEVMGNQHKLTALMGEPPRFFRPGTAHFDEVCAAMVRALGLLPVNFDINADNGATASTSAVVAAMDGAVTGSICIGHFNQPAGSTFEGLAQAIPRLRSAGLTFARLDEMTLS